MFPSKNLTPNDLKLSKQHPSSIKIAIQAHSHSFTTTQSPIHAMDLIRIHHSLTTRRFGNFLKQVVKKPEDLKYPQESKPI